MLQHNLKIEKRKEKEKNHIPREELNSKYSSSQNASCAVCMVQGKKKIHYNCLALFINLHLRDLP